MDATQISSEAVTQLTAEDSQDPQAWWQTPINDNPWWYDTPHLAQPLQEQPWYTPEQQAAELEYLLPKPKVSLSPEGMAVAGVVGLALVGGIIWWLAD